VCRCSCDLRQDFIIATEQSVPGRPAHLWIYDRKSEDFSGYKLALDRQPNDIVMYDARRQLSLDCKLLLNFTLYVDVASSDAAFVTVYFQLFLTLPLWLRWVCLYVCLSVRISQKRCLNFTKFLHMLYVAVALSSSDLWRQYDTLCTSGFVDEVMFTYNGPYGARLIGRILKVTHRGAELSTKSWCVALFRN